MKNDRNITFDKIFRYWKENLYSKVYRMLSFNNLPNEIEEKWITKYLFELGDCAWFKKDDILHCVVCSLGGKPNEHNEGTLVVISNPVLGSFEFNRYSDSVVYMPLNTNCKSIKDLVEIYATLLANNTISINIAQINTRLTNIISAENEADKKSIDVLIEQMLNGNIYSVVAKNIFNGMQFTPLSDKHSTDVLLDLIEVQQYLYSQFLNAIGINAMFNMKRERLTDDEVQTPYSMLQINIKDIVETITEKIDEVNKKFGTEIIVELSDEWKIYKKHLEVSTLKQEEGD